MREITVSKIQEIAGGARCECRSDSWVQYVCYTVDKEDCRSYCCDDKSTPGYCYANAKYTTLC
jgi:hypothetical protein